MKQSTKILFILVTIILFLVMLVTYSNVKSNAENKQQSNLQIQLIQIVNKLQITLERHQYLPSVLASNKEIISFLIASEKTGDPTSDEEEISLSLDLTNNFSGTSSIFLMDAKGKVVSSSHWEEKDSFIGRDFSLWPYFEQAKHNILGRYFKSEVEAGERYYYFARSVQHENRIIGVVVVQVPLSGIASNWILADVDFVVTDKNGIVFLSSNSDWDLNAISNRDLSSIKNNQRYSSQPAIQTLNNESFELESYGFEFIELLGKKYQMLSEGMDIAGWDVRVLSNYEIAQNEISRRMFIASVLLFLLVALAGLMFKIQNQRKEFQQQATEELENKVIERTRALKRSQEDLIQAAKMAALGQLSTGITHEINNPLAAIRAYADNASQFLEKDRLDMVGQNLSEITKLTENMAAITSQLKSFARKSKGQLKPVNLDSTIKNTISIVNSKVVSSGTNIDFKNSTGDQEIMVMADEVWLSQVLVNLITNAISATNQNTERKVWIDIKKLEAPESTDHEEKRHRYCVEVRDNGTGIEESNLPKIFEPFFTTKPTKKGLGLGLSISFNLVKDMNGTLDARNRASGGALFTLCLQSAN